MKSSIFSCRAALEPEVETAAFDGETALRRFRVEPSQEGLANEARNFQLQGEISVSGVLVRRTSWEGI